MSYHEVLSQRAIALSISESPDLAMLGLGPEHLLDAMTEVARHLLALGARLYYGGDLRPKGFTQVLLELALRHRRDADIGDQRPAVTNVLAWPVFASTPSDVLVRTLDVFGPLAELIWLDRDGQPNVGSRADFENKPRDEVPEAEWAPGLTAMRHFVTRECDARVLLGGRRTGFRGSMPGVLQEALISLDEQLPLYVLGGFGGCAADLGVWLGLREGHQGHANTDASHDVQRQFERFKPDELRNGLTPDENRILTSTVHLDQAIALMLRGLSRIAPEMRRPPSGLA